MYSGREHNFEGPRINHRIRVPSVRIILEDGTQKVLPTDEALKLAQNSGLDLIEISPTAKPPVCKIMELGKWKYEQEKKVKEQKRNASKVELKQIRLRPVTEEHDLAFKIKNSREFLQEGHKVQFEVRFKGRELSHINTAESVLERVANELADIGKVERFPVHENRATIMIISPK